MNIKESRPVLIDNVYYAKFLMSVQALKSAIIESGFCSFQHKIRNLRSGCFQTITQ